ncbi:restriction endonuclease subunit S [Pontibacter amylolyticus]|uniref:Type I restriction modification DNA specificity domain-containing protein n=1 Tax=Pontibacter amylolyticus TaxID=1424080 RepID=A0ABQ1W669_9BACT|nr:restriction endonuclease subunit S [Pontibacter amylolyticus]GGG14668.1 hypothetical protein GCM10011323_18870 [Pontibacter amylolyticus]
MTNWKTYNLTEVVDKRRGISYGIVQPGTFVDDGVPIIKVNNLTDRKLSFSDVQKVKPEVEAKYQRTKLRGNEILISLVGSLGHVAKVNEAMIGWNVARAVGVLPISDSFDKEWIFWFLKSPQAQNFVHGQATTSVQATLNLKELQELQIAYPDEKYRKKASEILSALDDKIELNRRMNQTLEQMAQTLFRQYFVDGIDEENLPEGWAKKSLGQLVDITSSKRIFLNEYVPEGIPFYRGKEIIQLNKTGIISTELFITEEKFETIKAKFGVPKEGDILLTSVGTIGVPYLVNKDDVFYFKDGNITWVKSYLDHVGPVYLYQWLISEEGQSSIDNITIGSTQKAVTIQSLKSMQVIVPPKELHDSVCNQLQALRDKINHNIKEIRALIQTRDSLLPKLMSGEIDVMQIKPEELHEPVLS